MVRPVRFGNNQNYSFRNKPRRFWTASGTNYMLDSDDAAVLESIIITIAPGEENTREILPNETLRLRATGNPVSVGEISPVWSSTNPAVATVSADGAVLGVSPGITTIEATVGAVVGTFQVLILNATGFGYLPGNFNDIVPTANDPVGWIAPSTVALPGNGVLNTRHTAGATDTLVEVRVSAVGGQQINVILYEVGDDDLLYIRHKMNTNVAGTGMIPYYDVHFPNTPLTPGKTYTIAATGTIGYVPLVGGGKYRASGSTGDVEKTELQTVNEAPCILGIFTTS